MTEANYDGRMYLYVDYRHLVPGFANQSVCMYSFTSVPVCMYVCMRFLEIFFYVERNTDEPVILASRIFYDRFDIEILYFSAEDLFLDRTGPVKPVLYLRKT